MCVTKWSECVLLNGVIKWSFGRISKKKRVTDHDFPPPFMWAENNLFLENQ